MRTVAILKRAVIDDFFAGTVNDPDQYRTVSAGLSGDPVR